MYKPRRLQAVFFDFDGVILDSVEIKTTAFARVFEEWGPEAVQRMVEYHRAHGGISRFEKFRYFYDQVLRQPLSDEQFDHLCTQFRSFVFDEVLKAAWIPGAKGFLEQWYMQYRLFVVSGTPEEELKEIIYLRTLEQFFREVRGAPASKEEIVQSLLKRYDLLPVETVFVGDAMTDYRAAQSAGIPFIGVTGTTGSAVFPEGTIVIPDLTMLEETIRTIVPGEHDED